MVHIDRYIHIYKFKYVYAHIWVRQQLEYTLKSKTETRETRGWAQVLVCPPLVSVRNTTRDSRNL
jgi:hypothetical protein